MTKRKAKSARKIAVYDCETDPFLHGRVPEPFLWGYYDGLDFVHFDSTDEFVAHLKQQDVIAYAHNGGKFDVHYLLPYAEPQSLKIISNRIVKINIGKAELRDSYAIIPAPLSAYKKTDIDYMKFEKNRRQKHMAEIIRYLRDDCIYTYEMIQKYITKIGATKLTLAGNAMKFSKDMGRDMGRTNKKFDDIFRGDFYAGGRCQALKTGRFTGVNMYDINSAYPFAMKSEHPTGDTFRITDRLLDKERSRLCFYKITARSRGAFFKRDKYGALHFPHCEGAFNVTGHELWAAIETGAADRIKIIICYEFYQSINFSDYVDYWYRERKLNPKGTAENLIAKLFMNSLYGKASQNPENFCDYQLIPCGGDIPAGWHLAAEWPHYDVICRETAEAKRLELGDELYNAMPQFVNVATGASITGMVRAMLLRAIHAQGGRAIYCDTDSLFTTGTLPTSNELGQWKFEGRADEMFIAGKKLYAARPIRDENNKVIAGMEKLATKGVKLSFDDIKKVCSGKIVEWKNDAPSFSLLSKTKFVSRKIVMQK